MELESNRLNKRGQTQKDECHMFSLILDSGGGKKAINVEETNKEDKGSEGMGRVMDKRE